ncbi:agmatinase [Cyclobacterium lianum]|uniref:Agmatinase n=1 Tax=Cyclobacterium lianum TaxID=388280 RepID=A0A1M7P2G6_9BACT|nr:agmatinase family protein [Cyclobacterium lianum]SHN10363.1 agmatinase [Cyclobacterium lianum]
MSNSKVNQIYPTFDPNGVGVAGKLFGLPFTTEESEVVVLPVPWEVTVSYHSGTARGPEAILAASRQVDLFQEDIKDAWKLGVSLLPIDENLQADNNKYRLLAGNYIEWLEEGAGDVQGERFAAVPDIVNKACEEMNDWVYRQAKQYLDKGKLFGLLGGDHSSPLGAIRANAAHHTSFGILQIDAHADLRQAYEGFTYSHASIAANFLELHQVSSLVQVGIRDYCEEEYDLIHSDERIWLYSDKYLKAEMYEGRTWASVCADILDQLPDKVYLTIDIDGLNPSLCPHTGTPVPGGLDFEQVDFLLKKLVLSGRKIIGFDLVEVAPGPDGSDWDANVAARLLYRLVNLAAVSQGKLKWL